MRLITHQGFWFFELCCSCALHLCQRFPPKACFCRVSACLFPFHCEASPWVSCEGLPGAEDERTVPAHPEVLSTQQIESELMPPRTTKNAVATKGQIGSKKGVSLGKTPSSPQLLRAGPQAALVQRNCLDCVGQSQTPLWVILMTGVYQGGTTWDEGCSVTDFIGSKEIGLATFFHIKLRIFGSK